jgi:hypothetical protein
MTPLKASDVIAKDREVIGYYNSLAFDPAVSLPNQGFNIDMSNYPVGTDGIAHDPLEHEYF